MDTQSEIRITPEILSLIAEIDEFKGAWLALGTLAPERLRVLRRVATTESIGSSTRIAGSQLSNRDVERLLSNTGLQNVLSRDELEVAAYAAVMESILCGWREFKVTEDHITQLHRDLLQNSADERNRGEYEKLTTDRSALASSGNQIPGLLQPANPPNTSRCMKELVEWLRVEQELKRLHPLLIIAIFTVAFLAIHPFQDGNGRLSRILATLLLLQAGYAYVPFSSLETVIEDSKDDYYLSIQRTLCTIDTNDPDWQPWILFFLRALQQQKRRLALKIERERLVLTALPELAVRILEYARDHGRVTMAEMIRLTGASRNTLKQHFRKLVELQQLARFGNRKGSWYALK